MGEKKIINKNLDNELIEAKITIECLKRMLTKKGVCTEKELNDLIDSQLLMYKLSDEKVTYTANAARWS